MATPKKAASRRRDALPPVTVARFEQVTQLIERLAQEKADVFLNAMSDYQRQRLKATARGLDATEAASIAATIATQLGRGDVAGLAQEVQASGLQVADRPEPQELLLASGMRTAPAFLDAALRVCALIEMNAEYFEAALEAGTLEQGIVDYAGELRKLPMSDARPRAAAALEHFTTQVGGQSPGEALRLLTGTVWQALKTALAQAIGSGSSSSTSLVEPTDGPVGTSSTT